MNEAAYESGAVLEEVKKSKGRSGAMGFVVLVLTGLVCFLVFKGCQADAVPVVKVDRTKVENYRVISNGYHFKAQVRNAKGWEDLWTQNAFDRKTSFEEAWRDIEEMVNIEKRMAAPWVPVESPKVPGPVTNAFAVVPVNLGPSNSALIFLEKGGAVSWGQPPGK
jgi:hypothetical protein